MTEKKIETPFLENLKEPTNNNIGGGRAVIFGRCNHDVQIVGIEETIDGQQILQKMMEDMSIELQLKELSSKEKEIDQRLKQTKNELYFRNLSKEKIAIYKAYYDLLDKKPKIKKNEDYLKTPLNEVFHELLDKKLKIKDEEMLLNEAINTYNNLKCKRNSNSVSGFVSWFLSKRY